MTASLAIAGQATAAGITAFANEAADCVNAVDMYKPSTVVVAQADFQDLKEYFRRPRLFQRGTLLAGTRTQNYVYPIEQSSLAAVFPQWANRLSGVYGVRFTLHFRLQVAATTFHQGLLCLNFQYDDLQTSAKFERSSYSASSTNIPHVRLDISEKTMVELEVPFVMKQEFLPVLATSEGIGYMGFNTILPVQAVTGLAQPTYELYMYLSDLQLIGADNAAYTTVTLQSGVIAKELKETRLISKSIDQTIKVVNFLGRHVPLLSSITGTTEWALGVASGVAKYFGFSRPMIQDPILRVTRGPYVGETNVDVPAAGFVVGPMQSNTLDVDPQFSATDFDEMSFDFLFGQWSQCCVGQLDTTDTHALSLYATPVTPSALWFRAPNGPPYCNKQWPASSASLVSQSGNAFLPTTLMLLASNFRYWRGTIKFRFTFAKTKLHGGRYMISYNPGTSLTNQANITTVTGPEVATYVQPYGYSMICDLRDGNVFEFDVPYISEYSYLNFQSSSGGLTLTCIDPLQATGTVTTVVPFLVEVCGGSDFQLADFCGPFFVPHQVGTIYQQSGEIQSVIKENSQITIGERLTSVKQMIQMPSWRYAASAATGVTSIFLPPWWYHYSASTLQTSTTSPNTVSLALTAPLDTAACWAYMYAFVRGSTDHHFYVPYLAQVGGFTIVEQLTTDATVTNAITGKTNAFRNNMSTTPKVVADGEAPIHVRSPAYQNTVRQTTGQLNTFTIPLSAAYTGASNFVYDRGHFDRFNVVTNAATSLNIFFSVSAGDDAMLGQYLGPVPMYIPNSANTNNVETTWLNA